MEITEEDIKMLNKLNLVCSGLDVCIDTKRPFGNSGRIEQDLAERVLGWELFEDEEGETHLSKEQLEKINKLVARIPDLLREAIKRLVNKKK